MPDRSHVSVPHLSPSIASQAVESGPKCAKVGSASEARRKRVPAGQSTNGQDAAEPQHRRARDKGSRVRISSEVTRSRQRLRSRAARSVARSAVARPPGRRANSCCSRAAPREGTGPVGLLSAYEGDFEPGGDPAGRGLLCRQAGPGDQGADGGTDVVDLVVGLLDERRGGRLSLAVRPARPGASRAS